MATYKFLALAVLLAIVLPSVVTATDYVVGDNSGWTNGFNYTEWAQDKVFTVGDRLVFKYTALKHNVFKVNGTDFKDCIKPATGALTTGNDIITLAIPGKKWYICGVSTHCADFNQKLTINVVGGAPTPAPSTSDSSAVYGIFSSGYQALMAAVGTAVVALNMA